VPLATANLSALPVTQEGDGFEELYRQHAPRLYALATRMAGSREQGEDLLQEIFLQAFRKRSSFKGEAALGTWLYRIAINHCLDFVRSRQARMTRLTDALDASDAFQPSTRPDSPTAAGPLSSSTMSKDSITRKWRGCSASPKVRRNRRCSRRA